MKKNRVLTESGAYFPRCVALPARERLLLEEEMMLYMGQSGGTTIQETPAQKYGTGRSAIATINNQTQEQRQQQQIEKAAAFGIGAGVPDSSATSVLDELENLRAALTDTSSTPPDTSSAAPTNSDPQTEDTSEYSSCVFCLIRSWF